MSFSSQRNSMIFLKMRQKESIASSDFRAFCGLSISLQRFLSPSPGSLRPPQGSRSEGLQHLVPAFAPVLLESPSPVQEPSFLTGPGRTSSQDWRVWNTSFHILQGANHHFSFASQHAPCLAGNDCWVQEKLITLCIGLILFGMWYVVITGHPQLEQNLYSPNWRVFISKF